MNTRPKSGSAEALYSQAIALKQGGDYAGAIPLLEQAIGAGAPDDAHALLMHLYVATGAVAAGISFLTGIAASRPNALRALMDLGRLHAENGALTQALQCFKLVSSLNPGYFPARLESCFTLMKLGHYEDAVAAGTACLDLPLTEREKVQIYECVQDVGMLHEFRFAAPPAFPARGGLLKRLFGKETRDAWEAAAVSAIRTQIDDLPEGGPTLVFFHVDVGDRHPFLDSESSAGTIDYGRLLLQSCEMARRANPRSNIVVLTDDKTGLAALDGVARTVRLDVPANQLMYTRMRSARALVMSGCMRGPVLFLDTDILINRDFQPLFDGSFDVGLTSRHQCPFAAMPINEGVILGADGASDKLAGFFGDCLHLYEWLAELDFVTKRYGFDVRNWRGGQLSLAALVSRLVPPEGPASRIINGVRYRFFPCAQYNHAVSRHDDVAYLAQKWAVHFKGKAAKSLAGNYVEFVRTRA